LIGVVPQEISLYEDLSAYNNLLFWGNLYGIPSKQLKERIHTTLELIGLLDRKNDLIKTYSGGMKRRINIAAALLHQPKILFMDEPTVGIDPQSRNHIFEVIETLNKQGMTIVYTTHYMEEVERLCDRIAIIDSGKIIAQGTQSQLKELVQTKESIQFEFNFLSESNVDQLRKLLSYTMTQNKNKLLVESTVKELSKVITACNELDLSIKDIQLNKVNLEAIFLNLTGKQLRD
jgi:ABC-2 type transport system ATP-binding protein